MRRPDNDTSGMAPAVGILVVVAITVGLSAGATAIAFSFTENVDTDMSAAATQSMLEFQEDSTVDAADGPAAAAGSGAVAVKITYHRGPSLYYDDVEAVDGDGDTVMKYVDDGPQPGYEPLFDGSGSFDVGDTVRASCVEVGAAGGGGGGGAGQACTPLTPGDTIYIQGIDGTSIASYTVGS